MKILMPLLCLSALLLSGCASDNEDHVSGIEGTGDKVEVAVAYGSITGFGSVYVNGVHFTTDFASVEIDGEPAEEGALAVGMVVEVVGEINSDGSEGVAHTIRAERVLLGTVDTVVDIAAGRRVLKLLGQTVYVAEDAEFTGTDFEQLQPGLGLSVSGYVAESGYITATYLQQHDFSAEQPRVVEGYITAISPDAVSFELPDLSVDASNAMFVAGAQANLAVGMRVAVTGQYNMASQTLKASQIVLKSQRLQEGRYTALEGVVQQFAGGDTFWVRDTAVDVSNASFENGTASDLQNGAKVVVFGKVQNEVLVAERIVIKLFNTNRFQGAVSDIDPRTGTFRIRDTVFHTTSHTQFKDNSRRMERYFDIEHIHTGEDVEVYAVQVDGQWQVTRTSRLDFDQAVPDFIRGPVTFIEASRNFYIGDVLVDASELPESQWNTLNELQDSAITVDLEGYYTGDLAFKAVRLRVNANNGCDTHMAFYCEGGKPFGEHPFYR